MSSFAQKNSNSASNNFMNCLDAAVGSTAHRLVGENGSDMYSMYGIKGDNQTPAQAALVAAFSGIVDDTSEQAVHQLYNNVYSAISSDSSLSQSQKAHYFADLVTYTVFIRDIRNNGKGRRDQAYAAYLWLMSRFGKTMIDLLPYVVKHGGWMDLNKLYVRACSGDVPAAVLTSANYYLMKCRIIKMYVDQITEDRTIYDTWVAEKRATESRGGSYTKKCELSLATKWLAKENRGVDKKYKIAKRFAQEKYPELFKEDFRKAMRKWRQFYAPLQDALHTTEKLQCQGNYDTIDFRFVPGKCMFKNKKAFLYEKKKGAELRGSDQKRLKCRDNLMSFLKDASTGKTSVHGKTMFIHDLAQYVYTNWSSLSEGDKLILNAQFDDHVRHFREIMEEKGLSLDKGMVQADVSGSMEGPPMAGSVSLAILVSTLARGPWRNKFITFHSNPQLVELVYPRSREGFNMFTNGNMYSGASCNYLGQSYGSTTHPLGVWDPSRAGGELTFCEKVAVTYTSGWGGNTDFLACHDLMLDIAVKNNIPTDQMVEWVITASDMQFNQAGVGNGSQTYQYVGAHNRASYQVNRYAGKTRDWQDHHQILVETYDRVGRETCGLPYTLPRMIYWNMRSTKSFVTKADTPGVEMVGGMSTMQLKLFLEDMDLDPADPIKAKVTPWDTFQRAVGNECYDEVRKFLETRGGSFAGYRAPVRESGEEGGGFASSSSDEEAEDKESETVAQESTTSSNTSTASTSDRSYPSTDSDPFDKLRQAKKALEQGLLDQSDYDLIKSKVLSSM
jgi:hypothetical protein